MKSEPRMNSGVAAVSAMVALMLSACAATPDSATSTQNDTIGADGAEVTTATGDTAANESVAAIGIPEGKRAPISTFNFGEGAVLNVGTLDGRTATVEVLRRKAEAFNPAAGHRVRTISPDGHMIVIESSPGRVVARDGKLLLNMSTIPDVESAEFAPDNFTLFVTEKGGKLRVWGQANSFNKPTRENLENYLNRQASDFNVQFDPLSGPIFTMPQGGLLVGGADGVVSFWHSGAPSRTKRIMKLDAPAKTLSASTNDIVAVSQTGGLKVGTLEPAVYHAWSKAAKTEWAVTNQHLDGKFAEIANGKLALRDAQSGNPIWELPLPKGTSCGLAVNPEGRMGAACVDEALFVFNIADGTWDSVVWMADDLRWTAPNGAKIK